MKKKFFATLLYLFISIMPVFSFAQEPIAIELWHRWSGNNEIVLNEVIKKFEEENPTIKINVTAKAGEYFELLQQMLADLAAGNSPPDLFIGGYNLLNYIAEELEPVTIEQLAPDQQAYEMMKNRFSESIFKLGNYKGDQIGIPYAMSNIVNFVNMDIFREAGLTEKDIPDTWEEVQKIGKIIKEKTGKYAIGIQIPDTWADQALIYSAGGEMLNNQQDRVSFNDEGSVRAITMWQDLVKKGYHPIATDPEILSSFQAGEIAMHLTTIMKLNGIEKSSTFNLKVAQCPAFQAYKKQLPAGGAALISFTRDKDVQSAVWSFLDFALSKMGMEIFVKTGYLCVTNDIVPIIPGQEPAYEQTIYARPWTCWPGGTSGMEIEHRYLQVRNDIIFTDLDVQNTLNDLVEECNDLL